MVENCFSVAVFCICAAVLAVLLRQYCHEQSLLLSLGACTVVVGGFMMFLAPLITEIRDIFSAAGISEAYISIIFKAVAICFITRITCDLCRDSGEHAIASAAELWGRGAITFISLPIVRNLLEMIGGLL